MTKAKKIDFSTRGERSVTYCWERLLCCYRFTYKPKHVLTGRAKNFLNFQAKNRLHKV